MVHSVLREHAFPLNHDCTFIASTQTSRESAARIPEKQVSFFSRSKWQKKAERKLKLLQLLLQCKQIAFPTSSCFDRKSFLRSFSSSEEEDRREEKFSCCFFFLSRTFFPDVYKNMSWRINLLPIASQWWIHGLFMLWFQQLSKQTACFEGSQIGLLNDKRHRVYSVKVLCKKSRICKFSMGKEKDRIVDE